MGEKQEGVVDWYL